LSFDQGGFGLTNLDTDEVRFTKIVRGEGALYFLEGGQFFFSKRKGRGLL
jgi:hypothetical protein